MHTGRSFWRHFFKVPSWFLLWQFFKPIDNISTFTVMSGLTSLFINSCRWSMLAPGKLSIWRLSSLNGGIFERFESPRITCGFLILICHSLAFLVLLICLSGFCNGVCLSEFPLRLNLLTRPLGWSDGDDGCGTGDVISVSCVCLLCV